MKHWFILAATAVAFTAFAPMPSQAQVTVDTPAGGVRIGEPPRHEERVIVKERERPAMEEREVRGRPGCDSKTVHEEGPGGSETRTKTRCD